MIKRLLQKWLEVEKYSISDEYDQLIHNLIEQAFEDIVCPVTAPGTVTSLKFWSTKNKYWYIRRQLAHYIKNGAMEVDKEFHAEAMQYIKSEEFLVELVARLTAVQLPSDGKVK